MATSNTSPKAPIFDGSRIPDQVENIVNATSWWYSIIG